MTASQAYVPVGVLRFKPGTDVIGIERTILDRYADAVTSTTGAHTHDCPRVYVTFWGDVTGDTIYRAMRGFFETFAEQLDFPDAAVITIPNFVAKTFE